MKKASASLQLKKYYEVTAAISALLWPSMAASGVMGRKLLHYGLGLLLICQSSTTAISLKPIGHIESVFVQKFGTPRQGCLAPDTPARLAVDQSMLGSLDVRYALEGIEAYSHVWLVWSFHMNSHAAARAKVQPPRLRGQRVGLFATRSPFRPNPIGLSLVRLDGITDGNTLLLSGVDLVDGTPVFDVKPYIPQYDAPKAIWDTYCAFGTQGANVVRDSSAVRSPDWGMGDSIHVRLSSEASDQLRFIFEATGRANCLITSAAAFEAALVQCLAADPRPVYRWRRQQQQAGPAPYELNVDHIRVRCQFETDETVTGMTVLMYAIYIVFRPQPPLRQEGVRVLRSDLTCTNGVSARRTRILRSSVAVSAPFAAHHGRCIALPPRLRA
eukprot:6205627-Pleurochrysis_carterae.AAC.1